MSTVDKIVQATGAGLDAAMAMIEEFKREAGEALVKEFKRATVHLIEERDRLRRELDACEGALRNSGNLARLLTGDKQVLLDRIAWLESENAALEAERQRLASNGTDIHEPLWRPG